MPMNNTGTRGAVFLALSTDIGHRSIRRTIFSFCTDVYTYHRGATLSIAAKGTLNEDIEEGAKVHLQVKYGLITLINQEAQLCDYVKEVDQECPLKKGDLELGKSVNIPNEVPPGKYTVLADVFTRDGDKITCLTATVSFHRGNKS